MCTSGTAGMSSTSSSVAANVSFRVDLGDIAELGFINLGFFAAVRLMVSA